MPTGFLLDLFTQKIFQTNFKRLHCILGMNSWPMNQFPDLNQSADLELLEWRREGQVLLRKTLIKHCGSLRKNGSLEAHVSECLVIREWHYLKRIGRCGLPGVGVALLEEVCHWQKGLMFQNLQPGQAHSSLFLLPVDQDAELSATFFSACPHGVACMRPCSTPRWLQTKPLKL